MLITGEKSKHLNKVCYDNKVRKEKSKKSLLSEKN